MNRNQTAKYNISEDRDDSFVPGSPAYRIGLVWPLTQEVVSLCKHYNAEQRLPRHVTSLSRRKGRTKDLADVEALESLKDSDLDTT